MKTPLVSQAALPATHRKLRAVRATPIVLNVSDRTMWNLFYGMARISRFTAGRVIADLPYERRMQCWYALSIQDSVDWLAIRAALSKEFSDSPASVFRNTHGN